MIVIVEGVDRVGKTTFINKLKDKIDDAIVLKDFHLHKIPYDSNNFSWVSYGKLDTSVSFLEQMDSQNMTVIVDRLHLTELVYGKVKRKDCRQDEIFDLDIKLSKLNCVLVYVKPSDWSITTKEAGEDQTELVKQFNFELGLTAIETIYTDYNMLDTTVNNVISRIKKENKKDVDNMIYLTTLQKELLCVKQEFANITTAEIINTMNVDRDLIKNFEYDVESKIKTRYGAYDITRYFNLFEKLKTAMNRLKEDGLFTRQCVIFFDEMHCFQSIQFLIRNHKLIVDCNMRSCNVNGNYENDIFICSLLADKFKDYFNDLNNEYILDQHHAINMNVGSLHYIDNDDEKIKEGDEKNVNE